MLFYGHVYFVLIHIYVFWIRYGRILRLVKASSSNRVKCDACYSPARFHWAEGFWGKETLVLMYVIPVFCQYNVNMYVQTCSLRRGFASRCLHSRNPRTAWAHFHVAYRLSLQLMQGSDAPAIMHEDNDDRAWTTQSYLYRIRSVESQRGENGPPLPRNKKETAVYYKHWSCSGLKKMFSQAATSYNSSIDNEFRIDWK